MKQHVLDKYQYRDKNDPETSLEFFNGEIDVSVYSYTIDSYGHLSLNQDETYKLYIAMKNYFEQK